MNKKKIITLLILVVALFIISIAISPKVIKSYQFYKLKNVIDDVYVSLEEGTQMSSEIIVYNSHGKFSTIAQSYGSENYYIQGKFENDESSQISETYIICYDEIKYYSHNNDSNNSYDECDNGATKDAYAMFLFLEYNNISSSKFDLKTVENTNRFILKDEYIKEVTKEWYNEIRYVELYLNSKNSISLYIEMIDTDSAISKMYITHDLDLYVELPEQIKTSEN